MYNSSIKIKSPHTNAKLEFGVLDDYAALLDKAGSKGIQAQTDVSHLFRGFQADEID
ncbi:MAG: hypothetical protein KAQ71_10275 [Desulfobulbaceae bacterium]|nr:hypothetical protein [Desulfobulbaceae bacterium]